MAEQDAPVAADRYAELRPPESDFSEPPSRWSILKTITWKDFTFSSLAQMPCTRRAYLTGISFGVGMFAIRWFATRRVPTAMNWGAFTFGALALLDWEYCRYQNTLVREQFAQMAAAHAAEREAINARQAAAQRDALTQER